MPTSRAVQRRAAGSRKENEPVFGYVAGNYKELTEPQKKRYQAVYCGICREIRKRSSQVSRLGLSYDMAFLALLLMSLNEPEEVQGERACALYPIHPRPWTDNPYIEYSADMNVALAYYNFLDDWQDDQKLSARVMAGAMKKHAQAVALRYPRQCSAISSCLTKLSQLEKANCSNPDLPADAFGELMAELMVYREDFWAPTLRELGRNLGRFIYLLDAVLDYDKDLEKGKYNPFLAMGTKKDPDAWETCLVLTMGRCAAAYERLPLMQDKALLDNILYSGVWVAYRGARNKEESGNAQ